MRPSASGARRRRRVGGERLQPRREAVAIDLMQLAQRAHEVAGDEKSAGDVTFGARVAS